MRILCLELDAYFLLSTTYLKEVLIEFIAQNICKATTI